jgi:predicted MFS family arabinose efflux permease
LGNAGSIAKEVSETEHHPAHWRGVFAMSLCVFALIASEFMPVSLLTPMAAELRVSEGAVGQGIAISGVFAVLTSLSISTLAGSMNRKALLLGLTAVMALSGTLVALAPNYLLYMIGRALIGVVVGGFWSMSAATAIRLVPASQVPRALAIFNVGNALATVLAAPLGSYLGSIVGWRGAFFCLVPVAVVALVWQWISLPSMQVRERPSAPGNMFSIFSALKSPPIAQGMSACAAFFMGQFILFTYIRPFLERVTRVDVSTLSLVLLLIGAAGFVGTLLIGRVLNGGLYKTLIIIPALMALIALGLIPAGAWIVPAAALLGMWGLLSTSAPVGWWSWVAKAMPHNAEAGGGLMVAVIQLAIAIGSTVGGLLFDAAGYRGTFLVSAAVLILASLLALAAARATRHTAAPQNGATSLNHYRGREKPPRTMQAKAPFPSFSPAHQKGADNRPSVKLVDPAPFWRHAAPGRNLTGWSLRPGWKSQLISRNRTPAVRTLSRFPESIQSAHGDVGVSKGSFRRAVRISDGSGAGAVGGSAGICAWTGRCREASSSGAVRAAAGRAQLRRGEGQSRGRGPERQEPSRGLRSAGSCQKPAGGRSRRHAAAQVGFLE